MAKRRRSGRRLQVTVEENVTQALSRTQTAIKSPTVARALVAGAKMIQQAVQAEAPTDTGSLQRGIYVASMFGDEYRPLVRAKTGRPITRPLKRQPSGNQALVHGAVFYGRFVQQGRKKGGKRGYVRARPFFRRGVRRNRQAAAKLINNKLGEMLKRAWDG
jgi:hypothetical protein